MAKTPKITITENVVAFWYGQYPRWEYWHIKDGKATYLGVSRNHENPIQGYVNMITNKHLETLIRHKACRLAWSTILSKDIKILDNIENTEIKRLKS